MKKYVQMVVVLFVISALSGLIMGVVNHFTAPVIEQNQERKAMESMLEIFPEMNGFNDITEDVELEYGITRVIEVFEDENKKNHIGYIVELTTRGYSAGLQLVIGVKTDGTIRGLRSPSNQETPTIGGARLNDGDYLKQFENLEDPSTLDPAAGLSAGATVTTSAVISAARNARNFVLGLQGLTDPIADAAFAIFGFESYNDVTGNYENFVNDNRLGLYTVTNSKGNVLGYMFRLHAPEPFSAPLETFIGIDLDGKIVGISYGEFSETEGWGKKVQEEAFINEFIGRSSIEQVDIDKIDEILGVTYSDEDKTAGSTTKGPGKTRNAIINAVKIVFEYFAENLADQKDLILGLYEDGTSYVSRYFRGHDYILNVYEVYDGEDNLLGYVYKTNAVDSYREPLEIFFALDTEGKVANIAYGAFSETDGFGTKAKEEAFINQLIGVKSVDEIDSKQLEDAISGATKTRNSIVNALDLVFKHFTDELFKHEEAISSIYSDTDIAVRDNSFISDKVIKEVYKVLDEDNNQIGYAFRVEAPNAFKGVELFVGLDQTGKVKDLYFTVVEETPASEGNWGGKLLETEDFINEFIGESDPEVIDGIDYTTGATKTRDSVIEGVKYVLNYYKENLSK